jgi:hypothetical protein
MLEVVEVGTLSRAIKQHERGLSFSHALTFEEWKEELKKVNGFARFAIEQADRAQFFIGDMLEHGRLIDEKRYAKDVTIFNSKGEAYEPGTLRNICWVCRQIPWNRRKFNLKFSYYQEVAELEPKQQEELLSRAEMEEWTVSELRCAARALNRSEDADVMVPLRGFIPLSWANEDHRTVRRELLPMIETMRKNGDEAGLLRLKGELKPWIEVAKEVVRVFDSL